ncbi:hypothetical protein CEUSTIGMA_g4333.t1 [Chlamydomonas eustigma]|uniref:CAAX prenyl protease 2/Lysostaphin resistance protein A-like domain-containing protein n=1 Tax=Chlamydomonas eustigma TaxID=1157962 RepID=A0A250X1C5_9CHLO|nr:hypothetical protein CEUSTIGMA_g4333.t1 [Chlamydomonas eustigma]|eukprot:GAX76887.1 hypothetical protein CEUSTIGMA_g4333.t1 [Chlamydomonas eustigma]
MKVYVTSSINSLSFFQHLSPRPLKHRGLLWTSVACSQDKRKNGLVSNSVKPGARSVSALTWGQAGKRGTSPASGGGGNHDNKEEDNSWGLLELSRLSRGWEVPWGVGRVVGGMSLWLASFVGVGFILIPAIYREAGLDIFNLSSHDKATFTLVSQVFETVVSLALIRTLTAGPIASISPDQRDDLFNYSLTEPFTKPRGWATWAIIGTCLSPLVVGTVAGLLSLTEYENVVGGRGTADGVAGMISMDLTSYLSLLSVTGVLAPILEETVFRGFLLTSLTKYIPVWAAIPASSFLFSLAHLSPKDFPVLFSLGCVLGILYVRSRNLLTPILVHGAWNSLVLTALFYFVSEGVDIEQLLKDGV